MGSCIKCIRVNRGRFVMITQKSLFHPQREIHYIGGTDILPPPLEPEEEARVKSARY